MLQGTWFNPYAFIIMIDSLRTINDTYKFVDDVTLTEVITPSADSQMQLAVNQVVAWPQSNFMNISTKKTKEILLGPVTSHLQWEEHVTAKCAKVNKRLHFLKLLKRAGVTTADLLPYYKSVIRPVVEYACSV
jgi:hypothetical protein